MLVELVGNFYNNHSLSIVNRNIAIALSKIHSNFRIVPLDSYDPEYSLSKDVVKNLKQLEEAVDGIADVQIRHTYPPVWNWPESENTRVVYIQPWEFQKAPFEWQYKFETFADALIVPSNFCKQTFINGGINPSKVFTIPNGYDETIFNTEEGVDVSHLSIDKDKFNFVYVGNSQWRKGLDILLNTWGSIFKKADNARLIIKDNSAVYGNNNILDEIVKLEYKTGCAPINYIDKQLSDEEMAGIYKASKVIVHPYRAEGFGMHIQEAVACGCLPIVSANGPTDDFLDESTSLKIPTTKKLIDITNKQIFACKPGDSMTNMGSHSFFEEPNKTDLHSLLFYAYQSHNLDDKYENIKNITTLNTWDKVASMYLHAVTDVSSKNITRIG